MSRETSKAAESSRHQRSRVRPATVVAGLCAATLVRIAISGEYLNFVRPSMRIPLLISGVLLAAVAIAEALGFLAQGDELTDNDHHAHEEHGDSRVAWLLLIPVVTLLVFAPPSLSGWGASRQTNNRTAGQDWSPLTITPGQPVELSMRDFVGRALDGDASTVKGVTVRLTGFVTAEDGDAFTIVRYSIACCAADALASSVRVTGLPLVAGSSKSSSQSTQLRWVSVTGILTGVDGVLPTLHADNVQEVQQPRDPYDA